MKVIIQTQIFIQDKNTQKWFTHDWRDPWSHDLDERHGFKSDEEVQKFLSEQLREVTEEDLTGDLYGFYGRENLELAEVKLLRFKFDE